MATDGVDFVDEDDAGRILLGLLEHVTHAACADADEHFHEVRTGNGEERHIGFAGDGTRQKRLTGTRRANKQHAARNLAAEALELLRVAQEFHDFLEVLLGFVHTCDVIKRHAAMRFRQKLGLGLAKAHRATGTALHLPHEEQPDAENEEHRQKRAEIAQKTGGTIAFGTCHDGDVLALQALHQAVVDDGGIGLKGRAVFGIGSENPVTGDGHVANSPGIHIAKKLGVRDFPRARLRRRGLEHAEQRDQQEGDHGPQGEISEIWVHRTPRTHTGISAARYYVPLT
ncbi:hypothetical protein D3C86_1199840 [compost metagenome]